MMYLQRIFLGLLILCFSTKIIAQTTLFIDDDINFTKLNVLIDDNVSFPDYKVQIGPEVNFEDIVVGITYDRTRADYIITKNASSADFKVRVSNESTFADIKILAGEDIAFPDYKIGLYLECDERLWANASKVNYWIYTEKSFVRTEEIIIAVLDLIKKKKG